MPHILARLMDSCQRDDVDIEGLADLISKDAAITLRVLGAVTHATHSRFAVKPGLRQALLALGMDTVKSLLIGDAVSQVFNGFTQDGADDLRGYWRHSYTVALASRKIAMMVDYPHLEEAYLAGLLHDVGRLALLSIAPGEYSSLLTHVDDAGLCLAEEQAFHINHCEAGALLIERFKLDSFLADSILYHHEPLEHVRAAHPLVRIVMLADLLASHGATEPALVAAETLFNLDAASMRTVSAGTGATVKEAAGMLGIDLSGTEQAMAVPYPSRRANDEGNARDKLVHEVQQIVMASESRRAFAHPGSEAEVVAAMTRSSALQFGFDNVIFLALDDSGNTLQGVALESSRQSFSEYSVSLDNAGAVSGAVRNRQVAFLDVDYDAHSLAERQLFRLLDARHLVCLPLVARENTLGAIVGAVSSYRMAELMGRTTALRTFSMQAAAALDAARSRESESLRIAEEYRQASRRIVHEASNPLAIIRNYLAVLDAKARRNEPVQAEVSILSQEIDHVVQILRELTTIRTPAADERLGLSRIVKDVVKFMRVTGFVPASIHIETQLQEGMEDIWVNAKALRQILVNLIRNAVEAMPESGEIMVATPGYINRDGRMYCVLTVSDSGPGIPPALLAKLFTPVRSIKSGDHAGLGLSIVYGLVQEMGGIIMCRSSDSGTLFEIQLPAEGALGRNDEADVDSRDLRSIGGVYGRD